MYLLLSQVGQLILEMSAKTNLKRVTLELGGKSPNIIFPDVDSKCYESAQELVLCWLPDVSPSISSLPTKSSLIIDSLNLLRCMSA